MIERRYRAIARRDQSQAGCINRRLVIVGAVLAICWSAALGSTAKGAAFSCRDRVLTDYGRGLKKMPNDRLPGPKGLPFGPGDLKLRPGQSVMVAGEPITYTLVLRRQISGNGRVARPASLDWTVALKLESVNRHGRPKGVSGQRRWWVRKLRNPERQFALRADDPGFYRVSVTIQKHGGPDLASFRQFVRTLPRREKLSVKIRDGKTFQPGDTVTARIENRGTAEAQLPAGAGLAVERLEGDHWQEVKADEPPSVMFEDPEFLPRGRASGCSFFTIPTDSAPGGFRFSAAVQAGGKLRKVVEQFAVL